MNTPENIKAGLRCHAVQWNIGECPDHEPGCKGCPYENDYHDPDELMADALELIEELEKKVPQWISVKERLPRTDEYVLVFTNQGSYRTGSFRYVGSRGAAWFKCGKSCIPCAHWMPMPELPREENNG